MDDPITDEMLALDEAIKAAGGVGALAARIKVAASAPSMWRSRGSVPAEHCPAIERETGVRCERLNPKVAWDVLRLQADGASPSAEPGSGHGASSEHAAGRATLRLKHQREDHTSRDKPCP